MDREKKLEMLEKAMMEEPMDSPYLNVLFRDTKEIRQRKTK